MTILTGLLRSNQAESFTNALVAVEAVRIVAEPAATSLDDHVLEVAERLRPLARARRARVHRVLLGLHPSTLADAVKGAKALRDDMGYAGRLSGREQMVAPLGAQPDGGGEEAVGVLRCWSWTWSGQG